MVALGKTLAVTKINRMYFLWKMNFHTKLNLVSLVRYLALDRQTEGHIMGRTKSFHFESTKKY